MTERRVSMPLAIPAKAGTQPAMKMTAAPASHVAGWIPAFAGMTGVD